MARKIYKYVRIGLFDWLMMTWLMMTWLMKSWWRNMSDIFYILIISERNPPWGHHCDVITGRLGKWIQCTKFGNEKCNIRYLYIFIDLWRHVWRNMSDIFYILSILEMLYYHAITLISPLDTLVTCTCAVEFGDV